MMEKEKNEILEMKLKDVLGLKVTFKNEKTNRMNIGKPCQELSEKIQRNILK